MAMGSSISSRSLGSELDNSSNESVFDSVPPELLMEILSYVPAYELNRYCRRVCRLWNEIISDHNLWMRKCARENKYMPNMKGKPIPKNFYMNIYQKNPYGRNLIRNSSGEEQLKHWHILSNGGDRWQVEKPPQGANPLPFDEKHSCFSSSYTLCKKMQTIHLLKEGVCPEVMDVIKPDIEISEWYAARFDCGCVYSLEVQLLDARKKVLDSFIFEDTQRQWEGSHWTQVRHVFSNYPSGVRYITFCHAGQDTQFWAGNYGSKMSEASVRFLFE